ncbi:MAG: hypothetical protein JWM21_1992 [Acidobacteria bacterium]|nr:hypothetical protein [Acidobacteriota bacterium]
MMQFNNPLQNVHVAAPCSADWEQMHGNERARFCGQCNLNVYNLSSMTRSDAEHLIASNEGRLCVRFYRRADGSILTRNCPEGVRAIQRKISRFTRAVVSALLSFVTGVAVFEGLSSLSITDQFPRREVMGTIAVHHPAIPLPPAGLLIEEPLPTMGKMRVSEEVLIRRAGESRRKAGFSQRH